MENAPLIVMVFTVYVLRIVCGFPPLIEALASGPGTPIVEDSSYGAVFKSGFAYDLVQMEAFQTLTSMAGKFESAKKQLSLVE